MRSAQKNDAATAAKCPAAGGKPHRKKHESVRLRGKKLAASAAAVKMPVVLVVHGVSRPIAHDGPGSRSRHGAHEAARKRAYGRAESRKHGTYGGPGRRSGTDARHSGRSAAYPARRGAEHPVAVILAHIGTLAARTANSHGDTSKIF